MGLSLSSCFKSTKLTAEEIAISGGLDIYNIATNMQGIAVDPAMIALRVNTLLYEATVSGVTDLNLVMSGTTNVKNELFGGSSLSSVSRDAGDPDIIHVTFTGFSNRYGKLTFNTHGKKLFDSAGDWQWEIDTPTANAYNRYEGNSYYRYHKWDEGSYTISGEDAGNADIAYPSIETYYPGYEDYTSEWSGEYYLQPQGAYAATPSYNNFTNLILWHYGSGSGKAINSTINIDYDVYSADRLASAFSRGQFFYTSGTEDVYAPGFNAADPKAYPYTELTMEWDGDASTGVNNALMTYGPYSKKW